MNPTMVKVIEQDDEKEIVEVASDPNPVELRHTLLLNVNQNLILMRLIPSNAV